MRPRLVLAALALVPLSVPAPAAAQVLSINPWKLVRAGEVREVAGGDLQVTAVGDWNRSTERDTRRSESWTQNGVGLDDLSFYAAVPKGKPLFRQRDKKKDPLPKFDPAMLPTDIAEWFENSARIALGSALFDVRAVRPARFAGADGIEIAYAYASEGDNLERLGIARAAVIGQKLYLVSFDAPKIHYFAEGLPTARAIMDSAQVIKKGR